MTKSDWLNYWLIVSDAAGLLPRKRFLARWFLQLQKLDVESQVSTVSTSASA